MQPAAGARDLNPHQVESNQLIAEKLSMEYKLWGYKQVSPPNIENLKTLKAGDAISNKDIIKIVADEQLGLRPEMTASISRAASTRLVNNPRPLRLWSKGTVFKRKYDNDSSSTFIEENFESGVELFGIKSSTAEIELLSLLLEAFEKLKLDKLLKPTLLIGHTDLMDIILEKTKVKDKDQLRSLLVNFDQIGINNLKIPEEIKSKITSINRSRGYPNKVLDIFNDIYGKNEKIDNLKSLFDTIDPISDKYNVKLQLDPTFQPHFELYNGLVFQLICKNENNNIVIAKGGRYDKIVKIFSENKEEAAGLGFTFNIDKIRELLNEDNIIDEQIEKVLIVFPSLTNFKDALIAQSKIHDENKVAIIELEPCENKEKAIEILKLRGCNRLEWID